MQETGIEKNSENDKWEMQQLRLHSGKLPYDFHFCQV
jgi:hypothetical protein